MGIYIIQILPAAKIRKYLYNLAELSLAEIILMCAAPGMLINAGVTRKSYQEKQGKYLNRRCFGFIYQDIQLQRQSSCIFKMGFVFSHCFVRVMAIRSFIKQIMCITLLDLLSRVFITPSRNKQTHMHTHRGLVGVNEELCCSIQQSISYICPNIMCTITWQRPFGCQTGRASTSIWALKRPRLPFSRWNEGKPGANLFPGEQNHIQDFALVHIKWILIHQIRSCVMQVMITFSQSVLWASSWIMSLSLFTRKIRLKIRIVEE